MQTTGGHRWWRNSWTWPIIGGVIIVSITCTQPTSPTDEAPSPSAPSGPQAEAEFVRRAHIDAYAAFVPAAVELLREAYPTPPDLVSNRWPRQPLTIAAEVLNEVEQTGRGIDARHLTSAEQSILVGLRFALARLRDQQQAPTPPPTDRSSLTRYLAHEEGLQASPRQLFDALGPTLRQLRTIASPPTEASEPVPFEDQCHRIAARMLEVAETQPALRRVNLDCASLPPPKTRSLTRATATLTIVDHGIIDVERHQRWASEPPALQVLLGRAAPYSQRHIRRLGLLAALGDSDALALAALEARHATCLAAVVLWQQGALGPRHELQSRLEAFCPDQTIDVWIDEATQDPEHALSGVEMWRLGHGPAPIVALDRFWWIPAGLIDALARPSTSTDVPRAVTLHALP